MGVNFTTIALAARDFKGAPDTLKKLASGLNGNVEKLSVLAYYIPNGMRRRLITDPLSLTGSDVAMSPLFALPFANMSASAGEAALLGSDAEADETFGQQIPPELRTIRVEGDCMHPFYQHGDILFVREQESADPGQTMIALLDGEIVACKKFGV